jgi:hypothetical protein
VLAKHEDKLIWQEDIMAKQEYTQAKQEDSNAGHMSALDGQGDILSSQGSEWKSYHDNNSKEITKQKAVNEKVFSSQQRPGTSAIVIYTHIIITLVCENSN